MAVGRILYVVDTITGGIRSLRPDSPDVEHYKSNPERYRVFLDASKAFAAERALRKE